MLIMWYRNLFIKITYMYSSLLKRRLQRVVLRITTAPRSRRREAAGSGRGPAPAPGGAAGVPGGRGASARPSGGRCLGRGELTGARAPISPRPGLSMPPRGEARTGTPSEPAFLGGCQFRGGLRVTFLSHGWRRRPGVCWRNSCPRPSLLPTPGSASLSGSQLRSRYREGENPSREPSFLRADFLTLLRFS